LLRSELPVVTALIGRYEFVDTKAHLSFLGKVKFCSKGSF
jgi:hypothetical protein